MNKDALLSFVKQKTILVPIFLYQNYKKLGLTLEEMLFMMYLNGQGQNIIFDPQEISSDLNMTTIDIMQLISNLTDKKILEVKASKNDKGIVEEKIYLDGFYTKYSLSIMETLTENNSNEIDTSIFNDIEKEFGRTLSPSELEVIKAWTANFKSELILEAVKEATLNGVSNIRYIDKILYDWDKKGIKTKEDVLNMLNNRKKENEPVEVFDYDWFDEDEDDFE